MSGTSRYPTFLLFMKCALKGSIPCRLSPSNRVFQSITVAISFAHSGVISLFLSCLLPELCMGEKLKDLLIAVSFWMVPSNRMSARRKGRIRSPNRHAIGRFSRQTERGVETSTRGCPILNGDYADLESSRFANGIQHMTGFGMW